MGLFKIGLDESQLFFPLSPTLQNLMIKQSVFHVPASTEVQKVVISSEFSYDLNISHSLLCSC